MEYYRIGLDYNASPAIYNNNFKGSRFGVRTDMIYIAGISYPIYGVLESGEFKELTTSITLSDVSDKVKGGMKCRVLERIDESVVIESVKKLNLNGALKKYREVIESSYQNQLNALEASQYGWNHRR